MRSLFDEVSNRVLSQLSQKSPSGILSDSLGLPYLHPFMVFLCFQSTVIDSPACSSCLVSVLNKLLCLHRLHQGKNNHTLECSPWSERPESYRPLPDDYGLRGFEWCQGYFPALWFTPPLVSQRYWEKPGMMIERVERIIWLAFQIVDHKTWLAYDGGKFVSRKVDTKPERQSGVAISEFGSKQRSPMSSELMSETSSRAQSDVRIEGGVRKDALKPATDLSKRGNTLDWVHRRRRRGELEGIFLSRKKPRIFADQITAGEVYRWDKDFSEAVVAIGWTDGSRYCLYCPSIEALGLKRQDISNFLNIKDIKNMSYPIQCPTGSRISILCFKEEEGLW